MFFKLFLAFTLIPVAEIYLIIKLGGFLGAFNTVAIILLTGFAGASLARIQGMETMLRVRHSLHRTGRRNGGRAAYFHSRHCFVYPWFHN